MSSRILPPALEPYLQLPPETSLILLTSTLGCSVNWLTARFISSALASDHHQQQQEPSPPPLAILLVSWIRDLAFWKTELRRTSVSTTKPKQVTKVLPFKKKEKKKKRGKEKLKYSNFTTQGIDITKLSQTNKFAFVDYLNNPTPSPPSTSSPSSPSNLSTSHPLIHQSLTKLLSSSTTPSLKILLILDAPDILLTTPPSTSTSLPTLLLTLRSHPSIHSTILSVSADWPLISGATQHHPQITSQAATTTPLEISSAAFVSTQAHLSRWVMGVRALETGAARDVSGVLRITRGGGWGGGGDGGWEEDGDGEGMGREVELLYLVGRDGNVKVFERGVDG